MFNSNKNLYQTLKGQLSLGLPRKSPPSELRVYETIPYAVQSAPVTFRCCDNNVWRKLPSSLASCICHMISLGHVFSWVQSITTKSSPLIIMNSSNWQCSQVAIADPPPQSICSLHRARVLCVDKWPSSGSASPLFFLPVTINILWQSWNGRTSLQCKWD